MSNQEKLQKIKFYHQEGLTDNEIARILRISSSHVGRFRELLGLTSNYYLKKEKNLNDVKLMSEKGLSDKKISEVLNIPQKTVTYYRTKLKMSPSMPETTYSSEKDRIKGYIIRNSKFMAKRRGIHFDLKYTDFDLPEYCPILDIKLTFKSQSSGNEYNHASLDRIDNNKGYIKGNVIVLSRLANAMKNCADYSQLRLFSKNITKLIDFIETQGTLGNITDVFPDIKLYPET